MGTLNLHMFRLFLEKVEEPEIKLQTSAGSSKKQESSRNFCFIDYAKVDLLIYFCFIDYVKGFDCVDHNKL